MAKWEPDVVSYSVGINAGEKSGQWQWALVLFNRMWNSNVEPDVTSLSASTGAYDKGEHYNQVLALLGELWEAK